MNRVIDTAAPQTAYEISRTFARAQAVPGVREVGVLLNCTLPDAASQHTYLVKATLGEDGGFFMDGDTLSEREPDVQDGNAHFPVDFCALPPDMLTQLTEELLHMLDTGAVASRDDVSLLSRDDWDKYFSA